MTAMTTTALSALEWPHAIPSSRTTTPQHLRPVFQQSTSARPGMCLRGTRPRCRGRGLGKGPNGFTPHARGRTPTTCCRAKLLTRMVGARAASRSPCSAIMTAPMAALLFD
eukprot:m.65239 g.65239  ORF g.65239 m.65239 type:complete len:111 (-) comp7313_c0_seq1:41-373(-)